MKKFYPTGFDLAEQYIIKKKPKEKRRKLYDELKLPFSECDLLPLNFNIISRLFIDQLYY